MADETPLELAVKGALELAEATIRDELGDEHPFAFVFIGTLDAPGEGEDGEACLNVGINNVPPEDVPALMGGFVGLVVSIANDLGANVRSFPVPPPSDN